MKKGDKLFVRVDHKNPDFNITSQDFQDHVQYLNAVSNERYFAGGGFNNTKGGMIIFKANDIHEAKRIAEKDPIIERNFYSYDLYEWELFILSEGI